LKTTINAIIKIIIGIILHAGLPLIGWGITDLSNYFSNSSRFIYIFLIIVIQIIVVVIDPEIGRQGQSGKVTIFRQRITVILLQILTLGILIVSPLFDRRNIGTFPSISILRFFGLGIFLIGYMIMNWAEIALGKFFSIQVTVQKEHQLITSGLFKYIRNPRYLGIIMNSIGLSLLFRSWLSLVITTILVVVLIWRILDEEKLMKAEFGEIWDLYKSHTWRLFPFVY
jgi:protein-S-isoprenylcysteine O-methyltransferase Ste14